MTSNVGTSEASRVLVVEDDASLAAWIGDYLSSHGHSVTVTSRGDTAIGLIEKDTPDLVVLDIMLPGRDGFDVCREVRKFYRRPILVLTARAEETDEVLGLELGADDYLIKPIRPRVLLARIKALLRRDTDLSLDGTRQFGSLQIHPNSRTVLLNSEPVNLSSNEFDLLWLLAKYAGAVVSRSILVNELRGIEYDGTNRSIDIRVSRLRRKLGDDAVHPYKIKTVWGKGYLLSPDAW